MSALIVMGGGLWGEQIWGVWWMAFPKLGFQVYKRDDEVEPRGKFCEAI
jgi:hypothetical protein